MSASRKSRRAFLKTTATMLTLGPSLARGRILSATVTRRDLSSAAAAADLAALGMAYNQMKSTSSMDPNDPHGWTYQANIHGVTPTTNMGPDGVWNQCQHGNWWFFPWHRMYLYFFERIVRKISGKSDFALPYWQWDNPTGTQLVLNPAFLSGEPLYDDQRGSAANSGMPIDSIGSILHDPFGGKDAAMYEKNFSISAVQPGFGGPRMSAPSHFGGLHGLLEGDGHDVIHSDIGGDMGNPLTAGRDPLFYVHHANVDRIWEEWLALGGGRRNPDKMSAAEKGWFVPKFTFFDENKHKVSMSAGDVLDTVQNLGYQYDPVPTPPAPFALTFHEEESPRPATTAMAPLASFENKEKQLIVSQQKPLRLEFPVHETAVPSFAAAAARPEDVVQLAIEGMKLNPQNRSSVIRVYLNAPPNAELGGTDSPYYAGFITTFRHGHDDMGANAVLDITRAVKASRKADRWNHKQLSVTLVQKPVGGSREAAPIPFAKASVLTSQAPQ